MLCYESLRLCGSINDGRSQSDNVQLGHDHQLVTRNRILLNGFGNDLFADTVGVDVGCIPSVETSVIRILEQWKCLEEVSKGSISG